MRCGRDGKVDGKIESKLLHLNMIMISFQDDILKDTILRQVRLPKNPRDYMTCLIK